jgi:hypothetical protein
LAASQEEEEEEEEEEEGALTASSASTSSSQSCHVSPNAEVSGGLPIGDDDWLGSSLLCMTIDVSVAEEGDCCGGPTTNSELKVVWVGMGETAAARSGLGGGGLEGVDAVDEVEKRSSVDLAAAW